MPYKKRKETGYPTVPKCVNRSGIIYGIKNIVNGKWFVSQTGRPVSYILREKRIAFASGQSSPLFDAMREYGPPERRTGIGKSKVTLYFPDPV